MPTLFLFTVEVLCRIIEEEQEGIVTDKALVTVFRKGCFRVILWNSKYYCRFSIDNMVQGISERKWGEYQALFTKQRGIDQTFEWNKGRTADYSTSPTPLF